MNPRKGSALARADLLRVLAAAGAPLPAARALVAPCAQDQTLAKGLGFYVDPASEKVAQAQELQAAVGELVAQVAEYAGENAPVRAPLRLPFWGLIACQPVADAAVSPDSPEGHAASKSNTSSEPGAQKEPSAPSAPTALTAIDFAARSAQAPPFQPLARAASIASRARVALSLAQPGSKLDDAHIVRTLSRMQTLPPRYASWPHRLSPVAPPRLWVLVDRSMAMRTLWEDQDHLLQCLGKWLGIASVDTFTIPADPFQPECAWLSGRKQWQPVLRPPPAGTVVLLLTLQQVDTGSAARWQQVAAFLAQTAASLWWYAPYGKLFSQQMQQILPIQQIPVVAAAPATAAPATAAPATAAPATAAPATAAALDRLLVMLACARRIEPALVRALRLLDPALAKQPQLEAQVWASPLLDAGFDVAVWRADQLEPMRRKFAALPAPLQQQIWHTLLRQHAVRGRAIEVQETLALATYARAEVQTRAMQQQVQQARQWLQGLLLCPQAHAGHSGFASFATDIFCFHAQDGALLQQHEAAFLQLFAIADAARQQQGVAALDPGALPLDKLATLPKLKAAVVGRYRLCQRGGQLVLQQVDETSTGNQGSEKGSPLSGIFAFGMGMPLELGWLLLDDGQRRIIQTHGQRKVHLTSLARLAQRIASGQAVHLQTPTLAMQLGQIVPPFGIEHGRDEYGLYALWHLNGQVLRLRYIEPGEFLMGSPAQELERNEDEGPQHRVVINAGFWLCESACTQALWQATMGQNPSRFDERHGGGPQHPVEQVSWIDVQRFLQKLNQSLPPDFPWQASLPTEAEWEYACRAGTTTTFSFIANIQPEQVNYDGNYPLSQMTHAGMARLLTPKMVPESKIVMTAREQEVLRWTAEGKTAYEVGQILQVSERTVNFHINNVVVKLGSSNKIQAAVKAASLGLLYAGAATGMYRECTVAVDALPCNDWGLYQMHGNVWEWCADRYGADAYAKRAGKVSVDPGLAQAWQPNLRDEGRCSVRGGGWHDEARWARSACRYHYRPDGRFGFLGFRLALRSRPR